MSEAARNSASSCSDVPVGPDSADSRHSNTDRVIGESEQKHQPVTTVSAEGFIVGEFTDHEDAHGMADAWNYAYPPAQGYPDFVVDGCDGKCGYDQ